MVIGSDQFMDDEDNSTDASVENDEQKEQNQMYKELSSFYD